MRALLLALCAWLPLAAAQSPMAFLEREVAAQPGKSGVYVLETGEEALVTRAWLADKGYDPEFGARPLRRLIQNEIEDRLSDGILSGEFKLAGIVRVTTQDGELALESIEDEAEGAELEAPGV